MLKSLQWQEGWLEWWRFAFAAVMSEEEEKAGLLGSRSCFQCFFDEVAMTQRRIENPGEIEMRWKEPRKTDAQTWDALKSVR